MKRTLQRNTELKMEEKLDVKVKQEAPDPVAMVTVILELCQQFLQGITEQVSQNDMLQIEPQKRAMVIYSPARFAEGHCCLLYHIKDSQTASKMKRSENQEKLVYQINENVINKGIWSKDTQNKSNLPLTEINKILKNMENKNLRKAVKSEASEVARKSNQSPMVQKHNLLASSHEMWMGK
ncbi:DNA-directed RNA polymerase III subunit RPC6-like [Narcine bancroftii]|uniref:DNA-directed RNA polymerase III subunit RPC6-like n=1 Tax=Narcine bancroftii TaxID=1343680 RepID=UPI0038318AD1